MEDILASIRRIIADDQDGGRPAAPAFPHAPEAQESRPAEDDPADEEILDLAESAEPTTAFRIAHDHGSSSHVDLDAFARALPEPEDEPLPPESVGDDDDHGAPAVAHPVAAATPDAPAMAAPFLSALGRHAEPASVQTPPQPAAPEPAAPTAHAPPVQAPPVQAAPEPQAAPAPRAQPEAVQPPTGQAAPGRQSSEERLLSSMTDSAVTQAFNMLTHTVFSQNAMTLEDVVKDMLRPLLKDWLDDNLPPLVERLVRAEIERVARGGGRR